MKGKKRWITNSVAGDIMLTLLRTGDSLTMLLIDMRAEGVSVGQIVEVSGQVDANGDIRSENLAAVVFVPLTGDGRRPRVHPPDE